MSRPKRANPAQLTLVPNEPQAAHDVRRINTRQRPAIAPNSTIALFPRAVLCGSFRKDVVGLRAAFEALRDVGCEVLSPGNVAPVSEEAGFVYMVGETSHSPDTLERRHLQSILNADFVWLHAPDGYVGISAAMEIGFAHASGVPIYCARAPADLTLSYFVTVVDTPDAAALIARHNPVRIPLALEALRHYYGRTAVVRKYNNESARDCLLLLLEEVGELAHAVRKQESLTRDHAARDVRLSHELADVLLYTVHLANIANVDLTAALIAKETINRDRFLARPNPASTRMG